MMTKTPTRTDVMLHLRTEYKNNILTMKEASLLKNYCEQVNPLLAPPSVWWNGAIADWHLLHCSYGLMGELLELENETNLIPLIKEFGDTLFYLVNILESLNGWRDFAHTYDDELIYDENFYCHLNYRTCLVRHVDIIGDLIKRRIFYGNTEVDNLGIVRHITCALVFLKMGYASCLSSYEEIYNRLLSEASSPEEITHWKNVICNGDASIFTETRDLTLLANRNLDKLLKGKNARYASGKFSLEDSIAKKDAVEDGKSVPNPKASL